MSIDAARRAQQTAVLAEPDRVQLLALILSDPRGEVAAADLIGGPQDPTRVGNHLNALVDVGLLDIVRGPDADRFRPTHDAIVRFGTLLSTGAGQLRSTIEAPNALLDRIADELGARFVGTLSRETVNAFVHESWHLLAARASVPNYLPVLTARFATDRLNALAEVRSGTRATTDVLFVCVHNAGRSQMAAAALRTIAAQDVIVRTAGSAPAERIEPVVWQVIEERGWAPVLEFPKPLTDEVVRASDYVVTMGCGEACPVVPGRRYLDWQLPDPSGRSLAEVRAIATDVATHVATLAEELQAAVPGSRR